MNRRDFLATGATAVVGASAMEGLAAPTASAPAHKFKLNYAPHFGMFKNHAGEDLIDQLKFMADQGFTALEDNGAPDRPVEVQEKIGKALADLKMTMGVFVATKDFNNPTFALTTWKPELREPILKDMRNAVEVAKRINAKWCTVVPGCHDERLDWDYQTASVIDMFRRCAEIAEKAGLVIVMEPLNTRKDHPKLFLNKISQGYSICRAVNSPSVKILYDMYHQQITEGNIIPNIDLAYSEVAYFQVGDNPGRKEPTSGEMNYRNIFKHIHSKGFTGVVGMEHGNSRPGKEGEQAVIDAYVWSDSFDKPMV
ncbi:MAG: TIM barrel protein [Acidobacteria bacterium]|nr:TIM barrel protein [Acidobacteriota bacterium]